MSPQPDKSQFEAFAGGYFEFHRRLGGKDYVLTGPVIATTLTEEAYDPKLTLKFSWLAMRPFDSSHPNAGHWRLALKPEFECSTRGLEVVDFGRRRKIKDPSTGKSGVFLAIEERPLNPEQIRHLGVPGPEAP